MTAWRMALRVGKNGPHLWDNCRELGVAAIQYDAVQNVDLSRFPRGEPKAAWSQLAGSSHKSLERFVHDMDKGHVIYVKKGPQIVGKGVVDGDYQFVRRRPIREPNGTVWQHHRPVKWTFDFPEVHIQVGRAQQFVVEPLTQRDVARLEKMASRISGKEQSRTRVADESDIEGLKTEFLTTRTKRSRRLRNKAFDAAHGVCAVCRRDFTKILGGRGKRVLQVHHRKQLSSRDAPAVTRLSELVVVCANCHLLLHLNPSKTMSVGELRRLLQGHEYLDN